MGQLRCLPPAERKKIAPTDHPSLKRGEEGGSERPFTGPSPRKRSNATHPPGLRCLAQHERRIKHLRRPGNPPKDARRFRLGGMMGQLRCLPPPAHRTPGQWDVDRGRSIAESILPLDEGPNALHRQMPSDREEHTGGGPEPGWLIGPGQPDREELHGDSPVAPAGSSALAQMTEKSSKATAKVAPAGPSARVKIAERTGTAVAQLAPAGSSARVDKIKQSSKTTPIAAPAPR